MNSPLITHQLTKRFDHPRAALSELSLELPAGRVVGLLGRNGSGKTTLINLACGLVLPSQGTCRTLGRDAVDLDEAELTRIGVVFQEGRFLDWMSVRQQLNFHASFYPRWDQVREERLLKELELDATRKISELSTGDRQKLGILLGVCHHPSLLLLDEPVSALDPIARSRMLSFLVDLVAEDSSTVVISSHILSDVEKIIDWVVCLDAGRLIVSAPLDELQETYAEWIVHSPAGFLPPRYGESWILTAEGDSHQARLQVRLPSEGETRAFCSRHTATIESRPLNLETIFPLLIAPRRNAA